MVFLRGRVSSGAKLSVITRHRTLRASVSITSIILLILFSVPFLTGCRSTKSTEEKNEDFFTSGSGEADRRGRAAVGDDSPGSDITEEEEEEPKKIPTLYERLGGEQGLIAIIDDFTQRVLADPRVNWERKGITSGGFFQRDKSVTWTPTEENVSRLKTHLVQFLSTATGGPAAYSGQDMRSVHADLQITKAEFNASVGDMQATLDKLQIPAEDQKELLAILESTRPQVVTAE